MKFSALFLVGTAASFCLATEAVVASDLSYSQNDRLDLAYHGPSDGVVLNGSSTPMLPDSSGEGAAAGDYADTVTGADSTMASPVKKATPYTFKYEHKHKTHANTTIEKLELARDLGRGFSISMAQEWLPNPKPDKSAGDAFHNLEPYKTRLDLHYSRKLSDRVTFKHRFRNDFKSGKWELKPRFQLQLKLYDNFSITPGYERINTYNEGKANMYQNQISMALEYKWNKFKYKYTREEFYSTNGVIYNNTRHNYKNKYVIGYAGKQLEPYLEVRNVSRSSTQPGRDDDIRLGVKYRF